MLVTRGREPERVTGVRGGRLTNNISGAAKYQTCILSLDMRLNRAVLLVAALAAIGIIAILAVSLFLESTRELSQHDSEAALVRLSMVAKAIAVAIGAGMTAFAFWLFRISLLTHSSERYPPPTLRVIRETKIVTGRRARRMAIFGYVLAVLLTAAGIGAAISLWGLSVSIVGR